MNLGDLILQEPLHGSKGASPVPEEILTHKKHRRNSSIPSEATLDLQNSIRLPISIVRRQG